MNYNLKITWVDNNEKYKYIETWDELTKEKLYKNVIEYLDILHENGIPYKPTFEKVKENFMQFGVVDGDVINNEFKRLEIGWNAWNQFEEEMKVFDDDDDKLTAASFTIKMDDEHTTIEVMGFEFL